MGTHEGSGFGVQGWEFLRLGGSGVVALGDESAGLDRTNRPRLDTEGLRGYLAGACRIRGLN